MGNDFYKDQKFGKSLKLSLIDALLYSIMVGAGESYLPAYALALGYSDVAAGVLTSLPLITGAFLQLFTPTIIQRTRKPKRWMVLSAAVQSRVFLPLIYFETHQKPNFWILILIFTLYWTSGFSINPYWTHWINNLVPDEIKFCICQQYIRRSVSMGGRYRQRLCATVRRCSVQWCWH